MTKDLKITRSGNTIYFNAIVDFPFNYNLPLGYSDVVYGSWELPTGKIGIGVGDYRRAEMILWEEKPKGFIDGNYGDGQEWISDRDAITAQDMEDLLPLIYFDVAGMAYKGAI